MFGKKRRLEREAKAKDQAVADLRAAVVDLIGIAEGGASDPPGWSLVLKPGERLVYAMTSVGLFEPRREPGHWSGGSAGFSIPVTDGIRFRIGKSAGTYVQGNENPTIIDAGDISFTTQRVVFQGSKYSREWLFSKLIGIRHDAAQPWTAIQVSNREKTSGIVYTGIPPDVVRLELAVAVAIFNGEGAEVASELREQLNDLGPGPGAPTTPASRPANEGSPATLSEGGDDEVPTVSPASEVHAVGPTATPDTGASSTSGTAHLDQPPPPPPMWAADPSGRHQLRYWDGSAWTEYVSDNGHEFREPFPKGSG
jgi:Protein of unknown function (DUF2510)